MARSRRIAGALLAAACIATALVAGASVPAQAADPVTINLVTTNDFHGRIERSSPSAGAAAIATAVKQFRAANPNTVFAAAGDLIGASTFTSFIQRDVPTIEALNAAGLEVSAVGNHEFDQGYDDLINRVIPLADWEYVGANVHPTDGATPLAEYWTKTMAGVTIGFIGAVTDELSSLVSPAGIANLTIEAPVVAANRVADLLTDGNAANGEADVIVLLVHEGAATTAVASATDPASRFGQIVNGASPKIDAIVSGHTHLAYNHVIDGRPVISSGQYGEKFSNMVIAVDPDTKEVLSMQNTVYDAFAYTAALTPDPGVASIVSAAVAAADGPGNVVVGNVTADFNRGNFAAAGDNRGTESTLGNFVADVQLWSANQNGRADIAFMNPGGLRADLAFAPNGAITFKEAAAVQPFANTLVTLDMTGAQVKLALEQQWQPAGSSRPVLRLGVSKGLTYVYDPTAAAGSRITRITFNGNEVKPTDVFRVVANSFLAAGGDNFTAIGQGTRKTDSGKIDLQSMVDWFAANGSATPDLVQRSVGIHLSAPDSDGYSPGDPLTIDLSSLDFTTNETKSGTVSVTLGGSSLGSATVDPAKVANQDEAGRARILTTIPASLSGTQNLVVTVPSTGTTATLPIEIRAAATVQASEVPTLNSQRLLDTRSGPGAAPTTDRSMFELQITGRAGVPGTAVAVALNVTVADAVRDGHLTVWPCGVSMPIASNVNYLAGRTVPNMVISKIGTDGKVCIYTEGSASVIVDVAAWFGDPSAYVALVPERILETRPGAGQRGYSGAKPDAGKFVRLKVTGVGAAQIPTSVDAVVLNVTGVDATDEGYVTVWECDTPMPTVSNLNLDKGETRANLVVTRVSPAGEVCLFTERGAHLLADVAGYLPTTSDYRSVTPERILETRASAGQIGYTGGKPAAGRTVTLQVSGVGSANVPATASSVILNVTGTDATDAGYVTVWACGTDMPSTSNLNLTEGGSAANLVIAKLGTDGKVCLYTDRGTHLIADVLGWFPAA